MAKMIVVMGMTGTQGGSVASHFLALGWNVVGLTRSITSPSALALSAMGVELLKADVDDPASLISASRGANVIFGMTDFWAPYFSSFKSLSGVSDRATGEHAFNIEVQRGKNIVDAVATVLADGREAGKGVKLERFIYSTLPSFKEVSGGKYTYVYHFDSKAVVTGYLKGKDGGRVWEQSSALNMAFYATNMIKYGGIMGATKNMEKGKYIFRTPASPGLFVDLLVHSPPKQDLLAVSEMATYTEYMKLWSEVTGVPSEVREITVEEADKAAPGGIGREAGESTATSAEFGWGKELVLPKDLDENVKTTSLRKYMESEDWTGYLSKL